MSRKEILAGFKNEAKDNGFYQHLVSSIEAAPESKKEKFWASLESHKFRSFTEVKAFFLA